MAEVRPFSGVRYNQKVVPDLFTVVCPPYDIISPQLQHELYQQSPYNFVRIEYSLELPQDTPTDNKYTRSAATLEQWLKQGVLKFEEKPAIYLYDQYFTHQGKEYKRRSLITNVRLEEWDKRIIRPHEGTLGQPKSDRVNLLRACQANTSPILALFEDKGQQISSLLSKQVKNNPIINMENSGRKRHHVWSITDSDLLSQIQGSLANEPLYIADGHHRYESALTYRREQYTRYLPSEDAPFNYVMMSLVSFDDPGLIILPPHRLIRGISKSTLDELMPKLKALFHIEKLSLSIPDVWQRVDRLSTDGTDDRLILFGLELENIFLLKILDRDVISRMMPFFHTDVYRKLTVSVVDHILLEELLGITSEPQEGILAYTYDRSDALNRVLNQEYQLAVILNPIKASIVKTIADAGERMPRKSTYFYPKLPSGIVIYHW